LTISVSTCNVFNHHTYICKYCAIFQSLNHTSLFYFFRILQARNASSDIWSVETWTENFSSELCDKKEFFLH